MTWQADTSWMADAACRGLDTDLFFPESGMNAREAKEVCAGCPVQQACLDYSFQFEADGGGVYGGMSERERRRLGIRVRRQWRERAA